MSRVEETRNVYNFMMRRPKERGQLGRPRRRWEDDIEVHLKEIGLEPWTDWERATRN